MSQFFCIFQSVIVVLCVLGFKTVVGEIFHKVLNTGKEIIKKGMNRQVSLVHSRRASFYPQALPFKWKKNFNPFLILFEKILDENKAPATRLLISPRVG